MKVYKIARGWAIFMYIFAPLIIALFGWLLAFSFTNNNLSPNVSWILMPISIAMIVMMIVGVIDIYKGRLTIYEDRITSISTFSNRVLKFGEIKGYTINDNYICIEPNNNNQKRIKISKYIDGYSEIFFWLSEKFPDLETQNAIAEEQEIFSNEQYGYTKDFTEAKLSKARQVSSVINSLAVITALWACFYPRPYQYAMLIVIIIPIVALCAVQFSKGLIRYHDSKKSAYPTLVFAFTFPSLVVVLRAILDFEIFDYSNIWLPASVTTFTLLALLLIKQKTFTFKKTHDYLTVTFIAVMLFTYSFGTLIHINCYYDHSKAERFTAKVLNKTKSSGKSTTHYLELSTWGRQKKVSEVSVGKTFYNSTKIGDEIKIYFKKGKLEIPWYIVANQ